MPFLARLHKPKMQTEAEMRACVDAVNAALEIRRQNRGTP